MDFNLKFNFKLFPDLVSKRKIEACEESYNLSEYVPEVQSNETNNEEDDDESAGGPQNVKCAHQ